MRHSYFIYNIHTHVYEILNKVGIKIWLLAKMNREIYTLRLLLNLYRISLGISHIKCSSVCLYTFRNAGKKQQGYVFCILTGGSGSPELLSSYLPLVKSCLLYCISGSMNLRGLKIKPDMFSALPTLKAIAFVAVTMSPCPLLPCSLHRICPYSSRAQWVLTA